MNREKTYWFVPDLEIALGAHNDQRALIEYVASAGSFHRDLGSMIMLGIHNSWLKTKDPSQEIGALVMVIADEIWYETSLASAPHASLGEMGKFVSRPLSIELQGHDPVRLSIISRVYFEKWLLNRLNNSESDGLEFREAQKHAKVG